MDHFRLLTPSYVSHKQSGRGRAIWTDPLGVRHQRQLPGAFGSAESWAAFARLQLELTAAPAAAAATPETISLNEVLLGFLDHAEKHYRRADGSPTHEVDEYRLVIRHVRELYGNTPAAGFGPLAVTAVRQRFVENGWCRSLVNQRTGRVKRMLKWAASEELIPAAVYQAVTTVQGLQRGRSGVRESAPVGPVPDAVIDATLPHLNRHVRGLVESQRHTGCRPGEACGVRMADIDTGGPVWEYRPAQHKTAWRGKRRAIAIGPRAQAMLRALATADPSAYLFAPAQAVAEHHAARGQARRTPAYPSHMRRNRRKRAAVPKRAPNPKNEVTAYGRAIARACDLAFPPPAPLARRVDESKRAWWDRPCATRSSGSSKGGVRRPHCSAPPRPRPTAA